jgi:cyclophilin family peptidyl-prolyl cis-trans isomerase
MGRSKLPDLDAEFSTEPHIRGTCSMIREEQANTANSQFFICLDRISALDNKHTIWGTVIEGIENIDKVAYGSTGKDPDKILSIRLAADI